MKELYDVFISSPIPFYRDLFFLAMIIMAVYDMVQIKKMRNLIRYFRPKKGAQIT